MSIFTLHYRYISFGDKHTPSINLQNILPGRSAGYQLSNPANLQTSVGHFFFSVANNRWLPKQQQRTDQVSGVLAAGNDPGRENCKDNWDISIPISYSYPTVLDCSDFSTNDGSRARHSDFKTETL